MTGPSVAAASSAGMTATRTAAPDRPSGGATLRGDELGQGIDRREDAAPLGDILDLDAVLFLESHHQLQEVDRIEVEPAPHQRGVVTDALRLDPVEAQASDDESLQLCVEPVGVGGHGKGALIPE